MKKTIIASFAVAAFVGSVFAQGTVAWNTFVPTYCNFVTNSTTYSSLVGANAGQSTGGGSVGATATTANGFYYQLLYLVTGSQVAAPTSVAALATWEVCSSATAVNNTGSAGRISPTVSNVQAATPADWSSGTSASIIMVGWSANLGSSYLTVLNELQNWSSDSIANAYFGISSSGYINPNATGANGATLFGAAANANGTPINAGGVNLQLLASSVPEPTTMALAGLGIAGLVALRRKK